MLRTVKLSDVNIKTIANDLNQRGSQNDLNVEVIVSDILKEVREQGDLALREYTKKFDKVDLSNFEVSESEINEAFESVEKSFIEAIIKAKENIIEYHSKQKKEGYVITREDGTILGQRIMSLSKVGVYVPGGTAAYPSSVLMNVIPAKVAGVDEIIMITPPSKDGGINPYIAATAKVAGVTKIFKVGGAQGIAALAYGTESIPKVDKVVGPGNVFVATAKKQVYGIVDIDMIAGPSEILVIADKDANPRYVAADLMSQAEHDVLASSILVTNSEKLISEVNTELKIQLKRLGRKDIIESSITNYGMAILCDNLDEAIEVSNLIAPEHLEILVENPMQYLGKIKNAGSVFLGENTPEPVGDYMAGTNHVLPTNGTARFYSPLSVDEFTKKSSFVQYSKAAIIKDANQIINMANHEGLTAHANSVKVRLV
ncbi:MAG: histidinol dehydrogenase [Clostridium sp.]